jgi:hypothetical protein
LVREVANRPSNTPALETEDIAEFRSAAPGMPIYKLGGGLMRECVNLDIKNGRLASRDKLKLFLGNGNMPSFTEYTRDKKFFSIPHKGMERKYWISYDSTSHGGYIAIYWLNGSNEWKTIYSGSGNGIDGFSLFQIASIYSSNLWVLSIADIDTLILENNDVPKVREMGMRNGITMMGSRGSAGGTSTHSDYVRTFGFEVAEIKDGVMARSSGCMIREGLDGTTDWRVRFSLPQQLPTGATHIRLWLSDRLYSVDWNAQSWSIDKISANAFWLYPVLDLSIEDLLELDRLGHGASFPCKGRNGFLFTVNRIDSSSNDYKYRIDINEKPLDSCEPSQAAMEASSEDTMNLVPMPSAQCQFDGILFGIKPVFYGYRSDEASSVVCYSSNPGTVYQEQTTALRVVEAGVGPLMRLVPMMTGIAAFGTKGIARVSPLGSGFAARKIASLDLSGMRCAALPGVGACCMGKGKVIFVDENTLEAGDTLMGLPIADMLGGYAENIRDIEVADNKLYIVAGYGEGARPRLFRIDLATGALTEITAMHNGKDIDFLDLYAGDNSAIMLACQYSYDGSPSYNGSPIILSFRDGAAFEEAVQYSAAFCASSAFGFVQHRATQVLAKLGRCSTLKVNDIAPSQFESLKTYSYQDYLIPAGKALYTNKDLNTAKIVEVRLWLESPAGSSDNDNLEILQARLSRLRQGEVSSPSFNPGRG